MNRHARQIRVLGAEAQTRLAASSIVLGGRGLAREIERSYLTAAGATPSEDGEPIEVDVDALGLRHAAARDVGEGALRALVAIRRFVD